MAADEMLTDIAYQREWGAIEVKDPPPPPTRYEMWLTHNNGKDKLQFPVLPERVRVSYGGGTNNVDVAGLGEIVSMRDRSAIAVSFETVFPVARFPGIHGKKMQRPEALKKKIMLWQRSKKPCKFTITETGINMHCVISDFTYEEIGGDKGSIYIELKLVEYREVKMRKIRVSDGATAMSAGTTRVDDREIPTTHIVQSGETLMSIARMHLGSEELYTQIQTLNPGIGNPSLLEPGTVLRLT